MAGSGSSRGSGGKKKARIEIIPLIDVIFFLLATFVLFTLSLNKSNGIAVALPKVATGDVRDPHDTVTISVTAQATIAWDDKLVDLQQFQTNLEAKFRVNPDAKILINADENATFHTVFAYVLNEIRKMGFQKVYFETKTAPAATAL